MAPFEYSGKEDRAGMKPTMTPTAASQHQQVLDCFLNPVRDILTPEIAQAVADLRADPVTQQRIEDLADRHHEGQLSPEELAEYEALVNGANVIAILQVKARSVLNRSKTP
jgi:hypothetical protein